MPFLHAPHDNRAGRRGVQTLGKAYIERVINEDYPMTKFTKEQREILVEAIASQRKSGHRKPISVFSHYRDMADFETAGYSKNFVRYVKSMWKLIDANLIAVDLACPTYAYVIDLDLTEKALNSGSNAEALIARVMEVRAAKGLHVRVTGFSHRTEPFNFYAKDEAQRDRFVASCKRDNLTWEIVK